MNKMKIVVVMFLIFLDFNNPCISSVQFPTIKLFVEGYETQDHEYSFKLKLVNCGNESIIIPVQQVKYMVDLSFEDSSIYCSFNNHRMLDYFEIDSGVNPIDYCDVISSLGSKHFVELVTNDTVEVDLDSVVLCNVGDKTRPLIYNISIEVGKSDLYELTECTKLWFGTIDADGVILLKD